MDNCIHKIQLPKLAVLLHHQQIVTSQLTTTSDCNKMFNYPFTEYVVLLIKIIFKDQLFCVTLRSYSDRFPKPCRHP